jgi:predicted Zn-dependent protease
MSKDRAPAELLEAALRSRDAGDRDEAERLLSVLLTDYPDDLDVRIVYGGILFHCERFEEAAVHFQRILESRPTAEPASLGLFHSLWHTERGLDAIEEMRRFFAAGGESLEYRRLLRDIRARAENSES